MPEINVPEVTAGNPPVSSLTKINIAEQIEYYFGDFNIMKDRFLKQEITKDHGWVPISTLLRFNRLAALSKDVDVILSSLKEHASSVIEFDSERQCVRRNPDRPIPEDNEAWRSSVAERTIYAKGFPRETTSLDSILKFMQSFGKIDNVFKRRYRDKALKEWKFKGSIYATFPTKEEAAKFMDIKSVKYDGNELIRKWQNDYIEEKKNERIESRLKSKESKNQLVEEKYAKLKKNWSKFPTGALIALTGLSSEITVNDLKKFGTENGWEIAFVEYSIGDPDAYVRLKNANSAKDVLSELKDGTIVIKDVSIKAEIVEGEKEVEVLNKMESERNSRCLENLKSKGRKNKSRKKSGKPDSTYGPKNNANCKNDIKSEPIDSKEGIVSDSMEIEAPVASLDDGTTDIKPRVVITAPDGNSAEANGDNDKPGPSEETTLKRKTEISSLEAAKKVKSEPAD